MEDRVWVSGFSGLPEFGSPPVLFLKPSGYGFTGIATGTAGIAPPATHGGSVPHGFTNCLGSLSLRSWRAAGHSFTGKIAPLAHRRRPSSGPGDPRRIGLRLSLSVLSLSDPSEIGPESRVHGFHLSRSPSISLTRSLISPSLYLSESPSSSLSLSHNLSVLSWSLWVCALGRKQEIRIKKRRRQLAQLLVFLYFYY
jgi:hypothetical protein